jgi:hypothetical protein
MFEVPSILYQIRYLLRAYFENKKDKKLMNMDTGDLGLRLHELAVQFTLTFNVEVSLTGIIDRVIENKKLN